MKPLTLTIAVRTARIASLVFICSISVVARQSALAKTGVTLKDLQTWAVRMVSESTAANSVWAIDVMPAVSPTVLNALQAMTPAEKLAVTQEVLAAIKATVMAPAFRAEHTARIGKQFNRAIDHGIDAVRYGTGTAAADMAATIIPIIEMMRSFPAQALQNAFAEDRAQAAETIKEETGEERAKAQKYLAQLNALAPLLKSNPEEFKKQYLVAKSASMGGPDTDAKLQAAIAGQGNMEKIRLEQGYWDSYNLNAILRKNLTKFIEQATGMDFKRPIRMEGSEMLWDIGEWIPVFGQLARHLGPAATAAAVQFARAWLKEVQ